MASSIRARLAPACILRRRPGRPRARRLRL